MLQLAQQRAARGGAPPHHHTNPRSGSVAVAACGCAPRSMMAGIRPFSAEEVNSHDYTRTLLSTSDIAKQQQQQQQQQQQHGDRQKMAVAKQPQRRPSLQAIGDPAISSAPLGQNWRVVAGALSLSLTVSLHLGYALGLGPAGPGSWLIATVLPEGSGSTQRFLLTCVFLGASLGAAVASVLGRRKGRRMTLLSSVCVSSIGWWLFCARLPGWMDIGGNELTNIITGRILVGVGGGMASVVTPVLIAESAPARLRGALGCLHQLGIGLGFTLAYAVGRGLDPDIQSAMDGCWFCSFRLAGWLGQIPLLLGGVAVYFMVPEVRRPLRPFLAAILTEIYLCGICSCQERLRRNGRGQSPRWLAYADGDDRRARLVLQALRGPSQAALVRAELAAISAVRRTDGRPLN
jgi:hypothetical protein